MGRCQVLVGSWASVFGLVGLVCILVLGRLGLWFSVLGSWAGVRAWVFVALVCVLD